MDTIKTLLEPIVGVYEPETVTVTGYDSEGVLTGETITVVQVPYSHDVVIPDYGWIAGVIVFLVALYSIFRAIGGMLKWKI